MQTLTSQTNYNLADEQPAMVCWCRFLYIIKHLKIYSNIKGRFFILTSKIIYRTLTIKYFPPADVAQ